jgi:hypothetical protein
MLLQRWAEAAPPIFADFLQHKEGALMILATMIMTMMCVVIQMMPTKNNRVVKYGTQIHMCSYGCH